MKREAFEHTKMKRLCRRMKIPLWQAVGILETLWQLTGKQAPRGDIGKLSNEDIAIGIDYQDDENFLIEALLYSGWLEEHPEHRLLIHDWDVHADDGINMKLARARLTFAVGTVPKTTRLPKWEREEADAYFQSVRTESKSVRTETQSVSTAYEYPAPPRPAPPYPSQQSSSIVKENKNGISKTVTTIDEQPKFATPKDELVALMELAIGRRPEVKVVRTVCEQIEIRGGNLPEYLADIRPRIERLRAPPAEGFFLSQARKWGSSETAPSADPEKAEERTPQGRCAACNGVGLVNGAFCGCKTGRDLQAIANRKKPPTNESTPAEEHKTHG